MMEYPNKLGYIYKDMKFGDILGEMHLNEELSEHYKKVSHKVKLMYKTLRMGGFKIDKLMPNMVPFWTGFEMIEDGDALITYELPAKYHLTSGNEAISYELIITGITINCEKYPGLADDIDIRSDILRKLSRKINNALKGTFDYGEQVKIQLRRKHTVPSAYENMIEEGILNDSIEQKRQIEKAKIIYKAFRKGTLNFKINDNLDGEHTIIAKYELPKSYKLKTNFLEEYMRNISIIVNWKDIKYEIIQGPENTRKPIIDYILQMIRQRIERFEYQIVLHFDNQKPNDIKGGDLITLKEEEDKYDHLIKKAPTVFKALKKGKITMDVDFLSDWRSQTQKKYTFDYDLGNVYIVETDPFENNYNVKILIPTIKINCDENPDLNGNQRIKMDILDKIKQKFQQFGLNVIQRASKFHLKHNGTWVKL
jgi:hypothetical protein